MCSQRGWVSISAYPVSRATSTPTQAGRYNSSVLSQGNETHTNALSVTAFNVLTNFNTFWKMDRYLKDNHLPASFLKISGCTEVNAKIIVAISVINPGCMGTEISKSEPEQTGEVACWDRDAQWRSWESSKSKQQENLLEVSVAGSFQAWRRLIWNNTFRERKSGRMHTLYVLVGTNLLACQHLTWIYIIVTCVVSCPGKGSWDKLDYCGKRGVKGQKIHRNNAFLILLFTENLCFVQT